MPPVIAGHKILHQRNKSSPALSTMANTGALKPAGKRSAFGDVSNTVNGSRISRDDSVISAKGGYEIGEKAIVSLPDKKAAALLRPAQRPLSIGVKALLNGVPNSSAPAIIKPALSELSHAPQPANVRKALTKRNTAIFKENTQVQADKPTAELQKALVTKSINAPVHRDLNSRQIQSQQERLKGSQQKLRRTQSTYVVKAEPEQELRPSPHVPIPMEDDTALRSDGIYIDDNGIVRVCYYADETNGIEVAAAAQGIEKGVPLPQPAKITCIEARTKQCFETHVEKTQPEIPRKHILPSVSEPEEYWDEEEEELIYDEEGYVTARSCKSRGDNTTGCVTTVLLPKVNAKIKKELADAKELIESTRTVEDIEDEAWDTSMVAEYGEEIFQYMKELEVSKRPELVSF